MGMAGARPMLGLAAPSPGNMESLVKAGAGPHLEAGSGQAAGQTGEKPALSHSWPAAPPKPVKAEGPAVGARTAQRAALGGSQTLRTGPRARAAPRPRASAPWSGSQAPPPPGWPGIHCGKPRCYSWGGLTAKALPESVTRRGPSGMLTWPPGEAGSPRSWAWRFPSRGTGRMSLWDEVSCYMPTTQPLGAVTPGQALRLLQPHAPVCADGGLHPSRAPRAV